MSKVITIDPITRLEGHGKVSIFLDDSGNVENAFLQIPEFRGFEKFCEGRAAEEMPRITSKICGVCPTAHHMASTKALDATAHTMQHTKKWQLGRRSVAGGLLWLKTNRHFPTRMRRS